MSALVQEVSLCLAERAVRARPSIQRQSGFSLFARTLGLQYFGEHLVTFIVFVPPLGPQVPSGQYPKFRL
jgi:hypothetical protein